MHNHVLHAVLCIAGALGVLPCTQVYRCGFLFVHLYTEKWPRKYFTTADIIRLKIACEIMDIDRVQSMFNVAVNTLGATAMSHK